MTFISGFFLVFAGMLIGYFLWYRDRSEDEQRMSSIQQEAEKIQGVCTNLQSEKVELEERLVRQRGQISILQQLCEDWSASREQADRDRSHLLVELEDKRRKCEDTTHEIQRLRQRQIQLEDEIHEMTRNHLEQTNALQQQSHLQQLTLESTQTQLNEALRAANEENQRLLDLLHQAEANMAELRSEIENNHLLLETATHNVSGLQQEYVSLESSLKQSRDELKKIQGERASALSQKKQAEEALASVQQQMRASQSATESLQQQLNQLKTLPQEFAQLQETLRESQQQLEKVTQQRDAAIHAEQSMVAAANGLQTRLKNQESTIHQLRDKHREAMSQLKQELDSRSSLEQRYQEQTDLIEQRIKKQQQQAEQNTYQTQTQLLQQASQLKQQLEQGKAEIEWLNREREKLSNQLQQLQTQPLQQPTPPQTNHQDVIPFSQAMEQRKRQTFDHEHQGQMERHPTLGMIYTEEPAFRDDLKRISGIAEVLEAKLNDVGIYTYKQVVDLTPAAIAELDRILKFKDRITRDRWQDQASQLESQKSKPDNSTPNRKAG